MKILYAGPFAPGSAALTRSWALERAGHELVKIDPEIYRPVNPWVAKIVFRLAVGPAVDRLNRDLLALAETHKPDIFWSDKVLWLQPKTLDRMRELGIVTVSYMIDNAFGPRNDPGMRLYRKCIPHFDLHLTQRTVNFEDYRRAGARDVIKIQTAYEPTMQYPPLTGWSDKDRDLEVSFVGTPYDDRAAFLSRLVEAGIPVRIAGSRSHWGRALSPEIFAKAFFSDALYDGQYREAIWRSKISLSFLTRSNLDEFTQKSFEIAGAGGFLLAERSEGHLDRFVEHEEAVFFSDVEECIAQIRRYLPDEAARARIAAAGHNRAERDGYHNDRQIEVAMERLTRIIPGVRTAAGLPMR